MASPDIKRRLQPTDVTIGMFARERDRLTAPAIDRLRAATPDGPHLVYVSAATPDQYTRDIARALRDFGPHSIVHSTEYLLPIQATNRLVRASETDVLALVQNDVMVGDNWLDPVLADLNDAPDVDYVSPEIMEARAFPIKPDTKVVYHFNPARSQFVDQGDGNLVSDVRRVPGRDPGIEINQPRRIEHLEEHAFFGRTASFQEVYPFPEHLNTREQIDMALRMREARQVILFDPRSTVTYIEVPLEQAEVPNYLKRWDPKIGQQSNDYVQSTWGLQQYKSSMADINRRFRNATTLQQ